LKSSISTIRIPPLNPRASVESSNSKRPILEVLPSDRTLTRDCLPSTGDIANGDIGVGVNVSIRESRPSVIVIRELLPSVNVAVSILELLPSVIMVPILELLPSPLFFSKLFRLPVLPGSCFDFSHCGHPRPPLPPSISFTSRSSGVVLFRAVRLPIQNAKITREMMRRTPTMTPILIPAFAPAESPLSCEDGVVVETKLLVLVEVGI